MTTHNSGTPELLFIKLYAGDRESLVLMYATSCLSCQSATYYQHLNRQTLSFVAENVCMLWDKILPTLSWFLASLILLPWKLRRYIPPKRWVIFNGGVSQENRILKKFVITLYIKLSLFLNSMQKALIKSCWTIAVYSCVDPLSSPLTINLPFHVPVYQMLMTGHRQAS
jgi:hypothetical protein